MPLLVFFLLPYGPHPPERSRGFHGNYVAAAGSTYFGPARTWERHGGNLNGMFYCKSKTRMADVADGLSNTLMLSEIVLAPDAGYGDWRGRYYDAWHGNTLFSTAEPPNKLPDLQIACNTQPHAPCTRTAHDPPKRCSLCAQPASWRGKHCAG